MFVRLQKAATASACVVLPLAGTGTGYGRPSIGLLEALLGVGITAAVFGVIGLVYWITHRDRDGGGPGG